jgi:hypothetical protein
MTRSEGRTPVWAGTGQAIAAEGDATGVGDAVAAGLAVGATVTTGATDGVIVDGAALGVVEPQATATRASAVARTATAGTPVGRRR